MKLFQHLEFQTAFDFINPLWYFEIFRTMLLRAMRHNIVKSYIDSDHAILDVGGAYNGNIGNYVSNDVVTINRYKSAKPNIIADGSCLPIRSNAFNIVTAIQVLHQIPENLKFSFLNELKRVACGRIIICHYSKDSNLLANVFPNICKFEYLRTHLLKAYYTFYIWGKNEKSTNYDLTNRLAAERIDRSIDRSKLFKRQTHHSWKME